MSFVWNTVQTSLQYYSKCSGRTCVYRCLFEQTFRLPTEKSELLVFTRKYKITAWRLPLLKGAQLSMKERTKYLVVGLNSKLHNVEDRVRKACELFPSLMHWRYTVIVRPILLCGAVAWWKGLRKSTYRKSIVRFQRLDAVCITGALRTTPSAGLELLLELPPIL